MAVVLVIVVLVDVEEGKLMKYRSLFEWGVKARRIQHKRTRLEKNL